VPPAPRNLDELRAIPAPLERATAAGRYIAAGQSKLTEARDLRDAAIGAALDDRMGPTAVARACGVSLSHVKAIKRATLRNRETA
jgi:hypothetical protein